MIKELYSRSPRLKSLEPSKDHQSEKVVPKNIIYDKETLYHEVIELKQTVNRLEKENIKLKTRIAKSQSIKIKKNSLLNID